MVATVDEPAPLVIAFAAHALAQGARCVHLFLDRPNPAAEAALAGVAGVKITLCTEQHWRDSARKMRPPLHVGRQKENARQVYVSTPAQWMLSIDCDEFLIDGAALQADLADLDPAADFMRIPVKERVLPPDTVQRGIFDGVFRAPVPNYQRNGPRIYGEFSDFFRLGMTGHAIGKSVFRTGRGLQMCLHAPLDAPMGVVAPRASLRHFDGLTDLHYAMKLLRRAREPVFKGKPRHGAPRMAQFQIMAEIARNPAMVQEMVARVKRLTDEQAAQLRELAVLEETGFDPSAALAALGLAPDMSVAAFDAELRARDGDLIAATKLAI
ncbi:MAG: glycosyltransferase family 2 protein [Cypionkella sp.]|nr:glycosyltransferase family 2 protein [Cypionkella sp.]